MTLHASKSAAAPVKRRRVPPEFTKEKNERRAARTVARQGMDAARAIEVWAKHDLRAAAAATKRARADLRALRAAEKAAREAKKLASARKWEEWAKLKAAKDASWRLRWQRA